jgi:hypothetical protein
MQPESFFFASFIFCGKIESGGAEERGKLLIITRDTERTFSVIQS